MKFFIIHGSYGNPNENWFPWLKKELEKEGCIVFIPEFPTPENQSLKNWMEIFNDFYQNCPVLTEKPDIKNARLNLILAYKQTIKNALNLLGIEAPEMM